VDSKLQLRCCRKKEEAWQLMQYHIVIGLSSMMLYHIEIGLFRMMLYYIEIGLSSMMLYHIEIGLSCMALNFIKIGLSCMVLNFIKIGLSCMVLNFIKIGLLGVMDYHNKLGLMGMGGNQAIMDEGKGKVYLMNFKKGKNVGQGSLKPQDLCHRFQCRIMRLEVVGASWSFRFWRHVQVRWIWGTG